MITRRLGRRTLDLLANLIGHDIKMSEYEVECITGDCNLLKCSI